MVSHSDGAGARGSTNGFVRIAQFNAVVVSLVVYFVYLHNVAVVDMSADEQHVVEMHRIESNGFNKEERKKVARITARDIVEISFDRTYGDLVKHCGDNEPFRECLRRGHTNGRFSRSTVFRDGNGSSSLLPAEKAPRTKYPWWFKSMVRDGTEHALHAPWHELKSIYPQPGVELCAIEKIATTEFRKVFCMLNNNSSKPTGVDNKKCGPLHGIPEDHYRFVFLRDPLERFLSAFIHKCIRPAFRVNERHCEPNVLYAYKEGGDGSEVVDEFLGHKKLFFEAYVDTIALKWNVHFFPQSFYCNGLYRRIGRYDFVGYMNHGFYDQLHALGRHHHGANTNKNDDPLLRETFDEVFRVSKNRNTSTINVGKQTRAAEVAKDWYSAKTVKRVLQYLSIDYVMLNLTIPTWAEKILRDEVVI